MKCPLCNSSDCVNYAEDKRRKFVQCNQCQLVFVQPEYLPTKNDELAEYNKHQNHFDDLGYQQFLSRALKYAKDYSDTSEHKYALDFGCGPCPLLSKLTEKKGYICTYYDPLFYPETALEAQHYDLITCTEAIEHFHNPGKTFAELVSALLDNAKLIIMTKRVINKERFINWHYKNDPTHVCFFSVTTFEFLAAKYSLHIEFPESDIAVFTRKRVA